MDGGPVLNWPEWIYNVIMLKIIWTKLVPPSEKFLRVAVNWLEQNGEREDFIHVSADGPFINPFSWLIKLLIIVSELISLLFAKELFYPFMSYNCEFNKQFIKIFVNYLLNKLNYPEYYLHEIIPFQVILLKDQSHQPNLRL